MRNHHVAMLLRTFSKDTHFAISFYFIVQIILPALYVILVTTHERLSSVLLRVLPLRSRLKFLIYSIVFKLDKANLAHPFVLAWSWVINTGVCLNNTFIKLYSSNCHHSFLILKFVSFFVVPIHMPKNCNQLIIAHIHAHKPLLLEMPSRSFNQIWHFLRYFLEC